MTIRTSMGTITADEALLNYISLLAGNACDDYNNRGKDALARQADRFSSEIYNVLKADGYYDCNR